MGTSSFHHDHAFADAPKSDDAAGAIESNLAAYWLTVGGNPDGIAHVHDDISWCYSGGPYFNRVVNARLGHHDVDARIDEIISTFRQRQAALAWLIGPSTTPADLGERLKHRGFNQYELWKGMAHDLSGTDESIIEPASVQFRSVVTDADRVYWSEVVSRSFRFPRGARRLLKLSFADRASADSAVWFHNLGYLNGAPVAASTLFINDGVGGIYLVSTIPEARGMGLGTAMTLRALRQARELGCNLAVLQSTEPARSIYEKLGFRCHCSIDVYRLDVAKPAWKRLSSASVTRARRYLRMIPRKTRLRPMRDGG